MTKLTSVSIVYRRKASALGRQMEQAATNSERLQLARKVIGLIAIAEMEETLDAQKNDPATTTPVNLSRARPRRSS